MAVARVPPLEPLTPSTSTPSSTASATFSTTSFSMDSPIYSTQLTKVSFSKEVVKSSTLPLILETHSGGSDNIINGSSCEEKEINEDDEEELYPPQSHQTDLARNKHRAGVARARCVCCVRKPAISRPVRFSPALPSDSRSDINSSAVKTLANVTRRKTKSSSFSGHTSTSAREETEENRTIPNFRRSDSMGNRHRAYHCSLSAVFGSIERMDRSRRKENIPNSTFELYPVIPFKSIPVVLAPREDQSPIESTHDSSVSVDSESTVCPHDLTYEVSSDFVPEIEENVKNRIHDSDLQRETVSNSNDLKKDTEPLQAKVKVSHPVCDESPDPISSLHLLSHSRRKANNQCMSKNEEFSALASFDRDKFRNYIPYPTSHYSQEKINPGSSNDEGLSRKDISIPTALKNDSHALIAVTSTVSPTDRKQISVQKICQPNADLTYSILIEISPNTSSHPPQTSLKNETEEKARKNEDKTYSEEKHNTLSKVVVTPKEIIEKNKRDEIPVGENIYNSFPLESNTHPITISTSNGEQYDLVQETDIVKRNISYDLIIEISALTPSPKDSTVKEKNEKSSPTYDEKDTKSVKKDLQTCSDCFIHFKSPHFLRNESQVTRDISSTLTHKCTHHTSSFEESTTNKEYSIEGRDITRTETLESTMVENSALNTIYSLYSRVTQYTDKDKGTVAEDELVNSNSIVANDRLHSLPPSASSSTEPKQFDVESGSNTEQILSTFSSFLTVPDIPVEKNGTDNKNKITVCKGEINPPYITVVLSATRYRGQTMGEGSLSKVTSTSSLDASAHIEREEKKSDDSIVPMGRKKSLPPHPPDILPSQSIPTTLFLRRNNNNDQRIPEAPVPAGNNIAFSSLSSPVVPITEEIDNNSADTIHAVGRKKKLSPHPPSVSPSHSIPIVIYPKKDNEHWTLAARYYSRHPNDNFAILHSPRSFPDESAKERNWKNNEDKNIPRGRKKSLSPYPAVILHPPSVLTERSLQKGSEKEPKHEVGSTSREQFATLGSSSYPEVPTKEVREENSKGLMPPGRKTRLSPQLTVITPTQSIPLRQSPKKDHDEAQPMLVGQGSREKNFGMVCSSNNDISPPDYSARERERNDNVIATGRKNNLLPPILLITQNLFQQSNENMERSVEKDNGSLCKCISAPERREGGKHDTIISLRPNMTIPLKPNLAIHLRKRNKKVDTRAEEPISRQPIQERFILSISSPNIKIRAKSKEKSGSKRLSLSPPSTSIPLDLQLQETKESTSKEGTVEFKEMTKNSVSETKTTILPYSNLTYNLEERKVKEVESEIEYPTISYEKKLKMVSSPLPLPLSKMNENEGKDINSEQAKLHADHTPNQRKMKSLPTLSPPLLNIPPYREITEPHRMGNETNKMTRDPTSPRFRSNSRRTRSLLYISSSENSGGNHSEALNDQKIVGEDEEQIEELMNKRTFTSFDTDLSSASTTKALPFGSCLEEENNITQANINASKSQGLSYVIPMGISETKRIALQKKDDQDTFKHESIENILSNKNEGLDRPDGDLTMDISPDAKYYRIPEKMLDDTTIELQSTSTHSQTLINTSLKSRKTENISKEDELAKDNKLVDSPDKVLSHQQSSTDENKKKKTSSLGGASGVTVVLTRALSSPSENNNAVVEGKQDKQDDDSVFLRAKRSRKRPTSLTSSRRPSPYEVAPLVLKTTRRSSKVPRTEPPPVAPHEPLSQPPPAVPRIEPFVVYAAPRIIEASVASRVAPRATSLPPVSRMMSPPVSVALAEAVALDDAKEVLRLLRVGTDPDSTSQLGIPVLVEAVHLGSMNAAAALLSAGANPNARAPGGRTALHAAADVGRHLCVALLLRHGAQVNALDKYKQTSLHLAARGGHEAAVLTLIASGADSRLQDANGDSVVQVAHDPELRRLIRRKTIERVRQMCQKP